VFSTQWSDEPLTVPPLVARGAAGGGERELAAAGQERERERALMTLTKTTTKQLQKEKITTKQERGSLKGLDGGGCAGGVTSEAAREGPPAGPKEKEPAARAPSAAFAWAREEAAHEPGRGRATRCPAEKRGSSGRGSAAHGKNRFSRRHAGEWRGGGASGGLRARTCSCR
jgi:hypothetical protein